WSKPLHRPEDVDSTSIVHLQVGDHHIIALLLYLLQGFAKATGLCNLDTFSFEKCCEDYPHRPLIVHNQYRAHRRPSIDSMEPVCRQPPLDPFSSHLYL